jgi:hypothetical protein
MMKSIFPKQIPCTLALMALLTLAACGPAQTVSMGGPPQTVTVSQRFQAQAPVMPTVAPYRCGAWASTNAPAPGDTITIYAKVTHQNLGVANIPATATVHFHSGDASLGKATSDSGGYVTFTLPLQGRQPALKPATVDVTFTSLSSGALTCTAFFTPG